MLNNKKFVKYLGIKIIRFSRMSYNENVQGYYEIDGKYIMLITILNELLILILFKLGSAKFETNTSTDAQKWFIFGNVFRIGTLCPLLDTARMICQKTVQNHCNVFPLCSGSF